MTLLLGIDTGGTYTDAVLFDDAARRVVATSKALTTKHDLALGVGAAIDRALAAGPQGAAARIGLVSLSTTLATNAIVEQHGFPVALVLIGQSRAALERAGLAQALGGDPALFLDGGHDPDGGERAPLDEAALLAALPDLRRRAAAVAVSGYFAVRNPAHEQRVRDLIRRETGMPVTCGYELANALDAPRRALTALLNARLIPLLQQLILAVRGRLEALGVAAPLMVVKGDGSLIAAETALVRPVETILSGPAASVVGAQFLAGEADCVVSDIGGTTTDIAVLKDGRPVMDPDGASVGGYRTMVEAVAVRTVGLGGDSEIRLDAEKRLVAGPRRAAPLSLLARDWPDALPVLREQLARPWGKAHDGRFALRLRRLDAGASLSRNEALLWERLEAGPMALEALFAGRPSEQPLQRLVDRGLVILSAFTRPDAAHVLGLQADWAGEAAALGAALWARRERRPDCRRPQAGRPSRARFSIWSCGSRPRRCLRPPWRRRIGARARAAPGRPSAAVRRFLDVALAPPAAGGEDHGDGVGAGDGAGDRDGDRDGDGDGRLVSFAATLGRPLIGIGAPAATYYPEIARRLHTRAVAPPNGAVCNAVGAVAGGVSQSESLLITQPEEGRFRLHGAAGAEDFRSLEEAAERAGRLAREGASRKAREAGAGDINVELKRNDKTANVAGGYEIFVESVITATAYGRPRIAAGGA